MDCSITQMSMNVTTRTCWKGSLSRLLTGVRLTELHPPKFGADLNCFVGCDSAACLLLKQDIHKIMCALGNEKPSPSKVLFCPVVRRSAAWKHMNGETRNDGGPVLTERRDPDESTRWIGWWTNLWESAAPQMGGSCFGWLLMIWLFSGSLGRARCGVVWFCFCRVVLETVCLKHSGRASRF